MRVWASQVLSPLDAPSSPPLAPRWNRSLSSPPSFVPAGSCAPFKKCFVLIFFLFLAFHFVSNSKRKTVHIEELKSTGEFKKQGHDESPRTHTAGSCLSFSPYAGAGAGPGPFPLEF